MNKLLSFLLIVAVAAASGYAAARYAMPISSTHAETAYERVMRTKTIRCGYGMWPPHVLTKDPNTGVISGWAAEIIEKLAARASLKVEWVEETGWNAYAEGLNSGRFDVFCATSFLRGELAGQMRYSMPVTYSVVHFFTRADDHRFDTDLSILNDAKYSVAVMDGEISQRYPAEKYPNAKQVAITQMADIMQLFLDVQTGKADGVFNDPSIARAFAEKNPGTIRQVTTQPVVVYANAYGVGFNQPDMQSLLNTGLTEMVNLGEIDAIISKYDATRSYFLPVAKPYALPAPQPLP